VKDFKQEEIEWAVFKLNAFQHVPLNRNNMQKHVSHKKAHFSEQ